MEKELDMANGRKTELKMPVGENWDSKSAGVRDQIVSKLSKSKLDKELAALNEELKGARLRKVLKRLEKKK
jgi:hypothetical protein